MGRHLQERANWKLRVQGDNELKLYTEMLDSTLLPFVRSVRLQHRFMQDNDPEHDSGHKEQHCSMLNLRMSPQSLLSVPPDAHDSHQFTYQYIPSSFTKNNYSFLKESCVGWIIGTSYYICLDSVVRKVYVIACIVITGGRLGVN